MMKTALNLDNIAISAGGEMLLRGISLEIFGGERVAVTGPSGCGKSSLLRVVAGLTDPVEGSVTLNSREPGEIGWPVFRRRVVLVEQQPVMLDATVRENLEKPFKYRSADSAEFPENEAAQLLVRLGVEEERLTQDARSLSVGQQQRVALVRALLVRPDVLLLDEPTSALDREAVEAVRALIMEVTTEQGIAALIVSHDPGQAGEWCPRQLNLGTHRA